MNDPVTNRYPKRIVRKNSSRVKPLAARVRGSNNELEVTPAKGFEVNRLIARNP